MIAVIAVIAFCLGLVVAAEYAALQFMRAAKRQPPPVEEALAQADSSDQRRHT